MAVSGSAATFSASSVAWSRPRTFSERSATPCHRFSRFQSVSPWRARRIVVTLADTVPIKPHRIGQSPWEALPGLAGALDEEAMKGHLQAALFGVDRPRSI